MQQTGDASSPYPALYFTESARRTHRILEALRPDRDRAGQGVDFLYDFIRLCFHV